MASYWTKKEEKRDSSRTVNPWEDLVSHNTSVRKENPPLSQAEYECRPLAISLLELAQKRYSVRSYKPVSVSADDLHYILDCARLAPSAVNKQPWHFYVCRTEDALSKVRQCYNRDWFTTAPLVVVCCICHDEEWVRASDSHPHGIVDISIAAEHICLAATERGLGSCWVCNFDTVLCSQLFNLPDNQEPAVLIPLGYPTTEDTPEKNRKAMEEVVTEL